MLKITTIIARSFLGLIFVVFGLNLFLHFIPMPPPKGDAGTFMGVMYSSHYLHAIKCFEIVGGLLLLIGRYVPLGLTLVGPVVVNILLYSIFLDNTGMPMAIILSALSLFLLWQYKASFAGLVKP
jgi:uncharacterized membrane protein YphA (DoxX/SURF4 family)